MREDLCINIYSDALSAKNSITYVDDQSSRSKDTYLLTVLESQIGIQAELKGVFWNINTRFMHVSMLYEHKQ